MGVESRPRLSCLSILSPGLEKYYGNDICRAAGSPPSAQGSMGGTWLLLLFFIVFLLSHLLVVGETRQLWDLFSAMCQSLAAYPNRGSVSSE